MNFFKKNLKLFYKFGTSRALLNSVYETIIILISKTNQK